MSDALRVGISHEHFWSLTPKEYRQAVEAAGWLNRQQLNREISTAWLTAALMRQKKLPPLKALVHSEARKLKSREELDREHADIVAKLGGNRIGK